MKRNVWNLSEGTMKFRGGYFALLSSTKTSNGSCTEGALLLEEASIQHPISIQSASVQHPMQSGGTQVKSSFRLLRYAACMLLLLFLGVGNAWGTSLSLNSLSTGTHSLANYGSWATTTKNTAIYDDNNYYHAVTLGNNISFDVSGAKMGASDKGAAFVFRIASISDISIGVFRTGTDGTVYLYYMGTSMDEMTKDNCGTTGTSCDNVSLSSSSTTGTLSATNCAAGYYKVYNGVRYGISSISITSACGATAPGNISKGTPSSGTLRLTSAGSAASNNTWYWQSAADGTATNLGSGATKDVTAAGTYYIRSYYSTGTCWSDAKSITITADDLLNDPGATFEDGAYAIGGSALDLSDLFSSSSSGAVTYTVEEANGTGASISTASFSATTAGVAKIKAVQAANGYYKGVTKYAYIKVGSTTMGSHTITYTLSPINSSDATLTSSQVTTSYYIEDLTTINHSLVGLSSSPSSAKNRTAKVNRISTAKDNDKYVYLTFDVAEGYTFTPSSIEIKVANVSNATTFDAELVSENSKSVGETGKSFASTDGTVETWTISNSDDTKTMTGTVTLKIWPYAATAGAFRFGNTITITGTVAVATPSCTAPNHVDITPTTEDGNYGWRYTTGETLKLTATPYSSAGTGSPITSGITGYQWQKYVGSEWTNLVDGGSISGATTANLQISGLTTSNGGSYRCTISTGATCSTSSDGYFVRIFTLYGGYSGGDYSHQPIVWTGEKRGTVTINLNASSSYKFKFTDNNGRWFGNGGTIAKDFATEDDGTWGFGTSAGDATLSTGSYGGGDYVLTVDITHFDDGGSQYVNLRSVVYPKKTTYLQLCSDWKAATAKYAIYYWKGDDNGWSDFMETYTCDGDIRYAGIPVWATDAFFVRFNPSKESTGNFDNEWNRSGDNESTLPTDGKDYYNSLSVGGNGKYYGSWGTFSTPTYTITFAGGTGSSGSMSSISSIACDANQALTANAFTKTGYNFANWTANVDVKVGGSTISAGSAIANQATIQNIRSNITLTAQWTLKTTTITIDANTGNYGSTTPGTVTATYGSALPSFTAAAPANTNGYQLKGYYTGATNGDKIINADGTLVRNTSYSTDEATPKWNSETGSLTLYAQYEPKTFAISYYEEDGTTPIDLSPTSYTYGVGVAELPTPEARDCYTFDSWYSDWCVNHDNGGSGFGWIDGCKKTSVSTTTYGSAKFLAKWTLNSHTLTWNFAGGSSGETEGEDYTAAGSVNCGETLDYPGSMTKTGYTFDSWSSSATEMPDEDLTITASWTANNYTVTLDPDNGNSTSTVTATYDATMPSKLSDGETSVAVPTFSGYTFGGYYDDHCGAGKQYYTNAVASANTWDKASTATLYAKWTQTVTLNTGSQGSGDDLTPTILYKGTALSGFSSGHEAFGYRLLGYYTASSDGTKVLNADGSFAASSVSGYITDSKWTKTGATTLYAQWENLSVDLPGTLTKDNVATYSSDMTWHGDDDEYFDFGPEDGTNTGRWAEWYVYLTPDEYTVSVVVDFPASPNSHGWDIQLLDNEDNEVSTFTGARGTDGVRNRTYENKWDLTGEEAGYYKIKVKNNVAWAQPKLKSLTFASAVKYTLTYNANGGSCGTSSATQASSGASITLPTPTKSGYTCTGWWTDSSGGTKRGDAGASYTPSSDEMLYAQWTCTTPTFGTNLSTSEVNYDKNAAASALTVAATANGGTVTYQWYSNTANSTTSPTPSAIGGATSASYTPPTSSVGTTYYFCTATNTTGSCSANSNITPVTVAQTYTVTYEYNGATGGNGTASATASSVTLPTPTKTSYTFDGWYTTAGTEVGDGGDTYNPTADITLYARWQSACAAGSTTLIDWTPSGLTKATKSGTVTPSGGTITYGVEDPESSGNVTTGSDSKTYYKFGSSGNFTLTTSPAALQAGDVVHIKVTATSATTVGFKLKDKDSPTQTITGSVTTANNPIELSTTITASDLDNGALKILRYNSSDRFGQVWVTRSGGGTCYHVYYHGNGATSGFISDPGAYANSATPTVLDYNSGSYALEKDGYTFQGWATSAGGDVAKTAGQTVTISSADVHLYAVWAEDVPCTAAPTVTAGSNSSVTSTTATVTCASGISALGTGSCTITSYGFVLGTSANPTLSNTQHEVGTSYTVTGTSFYKNLTGLTPSTTYYVRPYATNGSGTDYGTQTSFTTLASCTVTYNGSNAAGDKVSGSGSVPTDSDSPYDAGSTVTVKGNTGSLTKTMNGSAAIFLGWNTNSDTHSGDHYDAGETFTISGNTTLYAVWGYALNYNTDDGTINDDPYATYYISIYPGSGNITVLPSDVTKTGYTFDGWKTQNGAGSTVTAINGNYTGSFSGNYALKAIWTANTYTITLDRNGASTGSESVTMTYNSASHTAITAPTRAGYIFDGWYDSETDDNGSGNLVMNASGVLQENVTGFTGADGIWTKDATCTLYAKWTANTYNVDFDFSNASRSSGDDEGDDAATYGTDFEVVVEAASGYALPSTITVTIGGETATSGTDYTWDQETGTVTIDGDYILGDIEIEITAEEESCSFTLIGATLSSCSATGDVTGAVGGTSTVSFTSCEGSSGGYKMGKDGSYMHLTLSSGNFKEGDVVSIEITVASDQGDRKLHLYKYMSSTWTELGSITASSAGTYTYTLTAANVATDFNCIGLYRTSSNQNPYVKSLSVTRACTNHTVTWMVNGEEYTTGSPTTSTNERDGVTTLPTAPDDDELDGCANSFRGWSETNLYGEATNTQPADLFVTAADAPAITADKTFYAIFGTATSAAAVGTVLWSEDWTGESNNAEPSGPTTSGGYAIAGASISYAYTDGDGTSPGETYVTTNGGGNLAGGSSPEIILGKKGTSGTTGGSLVVSGIPKGKAKKVTLSYKQNAVQLYVYVTGTDYTFSGGGTSVNSNVAGAKEQTIICGSDDTFTLTFTATTTTAVRLDDIVVKIKEDGATNYRCICPSLTVTEKLVTASTPIFITSAASKTVRSQDSLQIVGSGLQKNATLSLSSPASKFTLKSAKNGNLTTDATGSIDTVAYIFYNPGSTTVDGLDSNNSFTITDGTNSETVSTKLIGRHLPENFVIAVYKNSKWWALPADMSSGSTPAPVELEVDNASTPTKAITKKKNAYTLYQQHASQISAGNGQYVKLAMHGQSNAPLYSSTSANVGKNGSAIITNEIGKGFWWQFTQKNTSTISNTTDVYYYMSSPNNNTGNYRVRLYNNSGKSDEKWGQYTSDEDNIRLLTWEPSGYDITNGNPTGGTIAITDGSSAITSAEEGATVHIEAEAANGYTFTSWSVTETESGDDVTLDDDEDEAENSFTMPEAAVTVDATFTPNTYDITYHLNGASWASTAGVASYTVGTGATLPVAGNMTNTGYTFGGWYDNSGLTGSAVTTISTSDYDDKEFWAKWTENTYTITYNANGGSGSTTATEGHYVTVADCGFELASNIFTGWNTATDGSGASYAAGEEIELTANMTLYAQWASDFDVAWTITKIDSKLYRGGGGYTVTAVIDDASWDAVAADANKLELSATEGVTLRNITKSINGDSKAQITANFDITTDVDEDATQISFTLSVPANNGYGAKDDVDEEDLDACSGGGSSSVYVLGYTNSTGTGYSSGQANKALSVANTWYTNTSPTYTDKTSMDGFSITATNVAYYWVQGTPGFSASSTGATMKTFKIGNGTNCTIKWTNEDLAFSKIKIVGKNTSDKEATTLTVSNDGGTTTRTFTFAKGSDVQSQEVSMLFTSGATKGISITGGTKEINVLLELTPNTSSGVDTELEWDDGVLDIANDGVSKEVGDPDFTFTASADNNTLGAITYSSSDESVATVNATTGQVRIIDAGTATITATLAASGCYEEASISYDINVFGEACEDPFPTITTTDRECSGIELSVPSGSNGYQWYKDDAEIDGATDYTYTATSAGEYYVIVHNTCDRASNTVEVEAKGSVSASKIVDNWYVKNGRRTPDVALVQTTDATGFFVKIGDDKIWDEANDVTTGFGGCGFYLGDDGIIYLKGQKNDGTAPSGLDANKTLKITATGCSGNADELSIDIKWQAATDRPSVAFVSLGTEKGAYTDTTANYYKTTPLYKYLDYTLGGGAFDLTAQNIYSTVDEQALREHYSQFDAILITDDPNTGKKKDGKSYVDALGALIDVRPMLTMEAFVSALSNWKAKGINGNPSSPNPRQYGMKLECKDHEIFTGLSAESSNVEVETIDGVDYWTVLMVDSTKSPYNGVAYNASTSDKPALQGFSASNVSGLMLLGEISDGALYAGVERQDEPAARLMLLGLNNKALPNALTAEGKRVISNALTYLCKTNMEDVDDCSNYFKGTVSGHETEWNVAANWSKGAAPTSPTVKVRILAPVELPESTTVRVHHVDIVVGGKSKEIAGTPNGSMTIPASSAMVVTGTVTRATAPYYGIEDLMPTEVNDIYIAATSTNNGTLILNNESGTTKATVEMFSKGGKVGGKKRYQYIGTPHSDVNNAQYNYYGSWLYEWTGTGWEKIKNGAAVHPWTGYCISYPTTGHTYVMEGTLVATTEKDIAVGADQNMVVGNSWTAPMYIKNFTDADFENLLGNVYFFNTGVDADGNAGNASTRYEASTYVTVPIHSSPYTGDSLISSMQGFFVKSNGSEGTLHLDYNRLVRPTGTRNVVSGEMHAPKRVKAESEEPDVLKLTVRGENYDDRLVLLQREDFSEGFDNGWDGDKWDGNSSSLYLYTPDEEGGDLSVSALPELEGTVVGFRAGEDDAYTIYFDYSNTEEPLYWYDADTRTYTPIVTGEGYQFFTNDKEKHTRFLITRTNGAQTPTGIEDGSGGDGVRAKKFILENKLFILVNGKLYDATGKVVK